MFNSSGGSVIPHGGANWVWKTNIWSFSPQKTAWTWKKLDRGCVPGTFPIRQWILDTMLKQKEHYLFADYSGGSKISLRGRQTEKECANLLFNTNCAGNCLKMKEIGLGSAFLVPPLHPRLSYSIKLQRTAGGIRIVKANRLFVNTYFFT